MKLLTTMGSICSNQNESNQQLPPPDLSELLQQTEKTGLPTPWLSEFQHSCVNLDQRTGVKWRTSLLEFILEVRTIIRLHKEGKAEKEETLRELILQMEERFFQEEEGVALADSGLRERLVDGLEEYSGQVMGAQGTINALKGRTISTTSVVSLLQQAYLDPNVWDKMDKLYAKFIQHNPNLPTLAVLLSIL
eukprot:GFUD01052483.1.p1 GENE.GFUD01052483.1~~GFUD01052483.1.p1  ORF type:complete len:192 (+),score=70.55 GFUD01052483.1:129-704(+)